MRYRVMDGSILAVILATGIALLGFTVVWGLSIGIDTVFFYGTIFGDDCLVWDAVFISGQSKKFCQFLEEKSSKSPQEPI